MVLKSKRMGGQCRVLYVGAGRDHADRLAQVRDELSVAVVPRGTNCVRRELAQFDCLVVRYDLPEMDGIELVNQVQRQTPAIPIILVAESGDEAVASAAISAGVSDYLSTTGQYDTLAARILHYADNNGEAATSRSPSAEDETSRQALKAAAMDKAPAGIVITDPDKPDNPLVYANERFTGLTGYEQPDVVGRNCRFLQGPATDSEPVAELREAVRTDTPTTVELRNYRADGTEFWNEVRIQPLRAADGTVTHYVGFQQDITARKRREQALKEEQALTRAIFDALPDAFFVFDTDGTCLRWSESVAEITGYSDKEIAQMGPSDFVADPDVDRAATQLDAVLSGGEERTIDLDIVTKDGRTRPYEVAIARITEDNGNVIGVVVTGRDISERKARTAELEAKNTRLEQFAKVISHDIRNPLQVADGQLTLAQDECESHHLDRAQQALDRMENRITELLSLAREGEVVTETEPVDIDEHAKRSWDSVMTGDATLSCETNTEVRADPGRLAEVFENLFRNAIEHGSSQECTTGSSAERGPETPDTDVGTDVSDGDSRITITVGATAAGIYVADDGRGISPGDRREIFESGYSTTDEGTGYGLHIVKEIAEAHGWSIQVTESESGGARFDITFDS